MFLLSKLKKMGYYFGIPFGCFVFYMVFCLSLQRIDFVSPIVSMFIGDVVCSVLFGLLFYRLCIMLKPKDDRKLFKFTSVSLFMLFILFVWQYIFGQAVSAWIGIKFPSEYISTYRDISDVDLILYLILSVTFAPIVEELLMRGLFYRHLRKRFSMMFCFFISSFVFMFAHGTTEHLPLTLALSMLICFVYEITDNMLYCILIHMFNNLVSIAYIIVIPISFKFSVAMFVVYVILMFVLFAAIPELREKMRYSACKPTLSDRLEEKRKHWLDINDKE